MRMLYFVVVGGYRNMGYKTSEMLPAGGWAAWQLAAAAILVDASLQGRVLQRVQHRLVPELRLELGAQRRVRQGLVRTPQLGVAATAFLIPGPAVWLVQPKHRVVCVGALRAWVGV